MRSKRPEPNQPDLSRPPQFKTHKGIGPIRTQRPIYHDLMPPCNHACPAGENIQGWLALATEGKFKEAWELLVANNPMPAIHGRVCYHPCENVCNRNHLDETVSIHAVERFLGDLALEQGWTPKIRVQPTEKRVLVVGAGPSGLSCAYHLALMGHKVEIHEAGPKPGGMMHFGIPAYRLPRNILMGEIERIQRVGVHLVLNHKVEDVLQEKSEGGFDAVFVAVGAHLAKRTDIPVRDAKTFLDAVSFLRDVEMDAAPKLGRRVAIYGGGNTAMDAARVAKRLGAEPLIIYRRDREHMPAHEFEADEAMEEGVMIHWLRTIKSIEKNVVTVEKMEIDETGRPRPTGEYETLEADDLILALGQDTDTTFLTKAPGVAFKEDGSVLVDSNMMTGEAGVFAGGDMVPSERSVTIAVGHGKKAARNVNSYLWGRNYDKPPVPSIASIDLLHLWYYGASAKNAQPSATIDERTKGFDEVVRGLTVDEAVYEAKRCLSCGNCFECDGCYGACPEDAVIKLGPGKRYRFSYDKCTGCATCFEQCPSHAIRMIPEQEVTA